MPRVSYAFYFVAALLGLAGMEWGSQMGASGDHLQLAAHAHLNLLGWVNMAIMGTFYALARAAAPRWLAWLNFALTAVGAVCVPVAMAYLFTGDESFVPLVIVGSVTSMLGMACFIAAIAVAWWRTQRAASGT